MRSVRLRRLALALVTFAVTARCDGNVGGEDASVIDGDAGLRCASLSDGMGDRAALAAVPEWYERLARWGRPDALGLTARNATWGALLDPREQVPAALLARASVALGRRTEASEGLRALEATVSLVDATTGRLPLAPPPGASGMTASEPDTDDATLGFFGEACAAFDALSRAPSEWSLGARVSAQRSRVGLALDAYAFRVDALALRDARDPERLLASARFFAACGRLAARPALTARAERLARDALALQRRDGAFLFALSSRPDVHFQARALVSAYDLALYGNASTCDALFESVRAGSAWLAAQIDAAGGTRVTERSRACAGELRFGVPVSIEPDTLVRALAYAGSATEQAPAVSAARRVFERARAYAPGYSSCD